MREKTHAKKPIYIYIYIYMKKVNRYFKDIGLENILKKIMEKEKKYLTFLKSFFFFYFL